MQRFLTSFALILALALSADPATALGFGKVAAAPTLGQPLSFVIGLSLDGGESVESKCVKAEVTLGDRVLPDSTVRARIEAAAGSGERRIRVTTSVPIDEPVIGINLHIGCQANLSRTFVVFADPPGRAAVAAGSDADGQTWLSDRPESAVAAALSAVPPASQPPAAPPPARPGTRARKRAAEPALAAPPNRNDVAAASPAVPSPRAAPRTRATAPAKPSRGPVLRLDPVEVDALISPTLQMATTLSQVPDSAASAAAPRYMDPEQLQQLREQERLKAMEAALLKLRSDSLATQKSLDDMQLRVRAAEAGRYANPLVYLLVALCMLLAAGLGAMWWLRRRDQRTAAWWTPPADGSAAPSAEPAPDDLPSAPLPVTQAMPDPPPRPEPRTPSFMPTPPPRSPVPVLHSSVEPDGGVVEPRRPMSAEELIDLEQQAEFFVVLGQDDAAIDLLMGHVRSTGGVSPLPYLKLLEIYRRRGEREPYDRIRERFNRRFNAYAPEWDVDPEEGLSLDGYPEVMSRLQRAWGAPSQAMELLDASLFRRDAGPTFDVPAYRELLFLYSLSRDLAERDVSPGGVDLLLPLDDEDAASTFTEVSPTSEVAPPSAGLDFTLDFDVSEEFRKSKR